MKIWWNAVPRDEIERAASLIGQGPGETVDVACTPRVHSLCPDSSLFNPHLFHQPRPEGVAHTIQLKATAQAAIKNCGLFISWARDTVIRLLRCNEECSLSGSEPRHLDVYFGATPQFRIRVRLQWEFYLVIIGGPAKPNAPLPSPPLPSTCEHSFFVGPEIEDTA